VPYHEEGDVLGQRGPNTEAQGLCRFIVTKASVKCRLGDCDVVVTSVGVGDRDDIRPRINLSGYQVLNHLLLIRRASSSVR
jgi:hypothetical protein